MILPFPLNSLSSEDPLPATIVQTLVVSDPMGGSLTWFAGLLYDLEFSSESEEAAYVITVV
jgi:hypothetical protein